MELTLNLAWILLAATMICLWVKFAPCSVSDRRTQFIALAVLILLLLPAISMTDDLQAAQNPAEAVNCIRRDHDVTEPHSIVPKAATPDLPIVSELLLNASSVRPLDDPHSPSMIPPALSSVQNRPPPQA